MWREVDAPLLATIPFDPRLGAQVHRRWWVAEAAVAGVRAEGQKLSLCLIDKTLVPVGRTFSAAARARFAQARNSGRGRHRGPEAPRRTPAGSPRSEAIAEG